MVYVLDSLETNLVFAFVFPPSNYLWDQGCDLWRVLIKRMLKLTFENFLISKLFKHDGDGNLMYNVQCKKY